MSVRHGSPGRAFATRSALVGLVGGLMTGSVMAPADYHGMLHVTRLMRGSVGDALPFAFRFPFRDGSDADDSR